MHSDQGHAVYRGDMGPPEACVEKFGIDVAAPKLNWKNVTARKDDVISRHTKGLDFLMKRNKITTFKGFGKPDGRGEGWRVFRRC